MSRSNWNRWIRQSHRWLSIAFTVAVIVNIAVLGQEEVVRQTVAFLPLLPLALLLFTGLYLFVLPYATKVAQRATHRLNDRPHETANTQ